MSTVMNVYKSMDAWKHREGGKEGDWKKANRQAWDVVQSVNKLRRDGKSN